MFVAVLEVWMMFLEALMIPCARLPGSLTTHCALAPVSYTHLPCIFGRHRWACACPVKRASDAMIVAMYFLMVSALEVR